MEDKNPVENPPPTSNHGSLAGSAVSLMQEGVDRSHLVTTTPFKEYTDRVQASLVVIEGQLDALMKD